MTSRISIRTHVAGAFLFAGLLISLCLVIAFAVPTNNAHARHMSMQGSAGDAPGFTVGWYEGQTVQFFYTRDFFCEPPPESGAPSQRAGGAECATELPPGANIRTVLLTTPPPR